MAMRAGCKSVHLRMYVKPEKKPDDKFKLETLFNGILPTAVDQGPELN